MVSEDSSSYSNNNDILQEFFTSNSLPETQFRNHHFDAYSSIRCLTERMSGHGPQLSDESDISPGPDRHLIDLLGPSNEAAQQSQRLSLSLGSVPCRQRALNLTLLNPNMGFGDYACDGSGLNQVSYGMEPFAVSIGSSKYLQPAQSLLEEMVSVGGNDVDKSNKKYMEKLSHNSRKGSFALSSKLKADICYSEFLIQNHGDYVNLLKLSALLEEVEIIYEEYSHHMEELVSSAQAIVGLGAAKSYTSLALLAMNKHFSLLRHAILSQIHIAKQKIMKDMPKISSRLSQLTLFDQESRQNRIMMQNSAQAWRPLRGLPETSVTILRAWLFEHFLHPYPNDSEKLMLASQTCLYKNQVSNWFINARVRLWKPMIEEMYKEEFLESSTESDQLNNSDFAD